MSRKQLVETAHVTALGISLLGGAFKLLHWPGANVLLIVGLGSLSLCYMLFAFTADVKGQREVYINYARNFSIALLLIGLLFYIMHWKGGENQLLAGIAGLIISFALQFVLPASKKDNE